MFALTIAQPQAATIVADGEACTLHNAIVAANTNAAVGGCSRGDDLSAGGDLIDLRTDVTLTAVHNTDANGCANGLPAISGILTISGNGHAIARSSASGVPPFRLIESSGGTLTVIRTLLRNGALDAGACGGGAISGNTVNLVDSTVSGNEVFSVTDARGGGILGTVVTLSRTIVSGNKAQSVHDANGGGVFADSLTISDSAITDNTIQGRGSSYGGGGVAGLAVKIINSTVSSNAVNNDIFAKGGGVAGTELTLIQSTVSGNRAGASGGGTGGGISGKALLTNSIVAGNFASGSFAGTTPSDCDGQAQYTGLNLIGDGGCGAAAAGQLTGDPKLGPLANNGGPTRTHALLTGSPAIDRVGFIASKGCVDSSLATDQRGFSRPQPVGGKCDLGAYEFLANGARLVLSKLPSRVSPVVLEGAAASGSIYIFTTPDVGVDSVDFQLDGNPVRTERYAPFDLAGTAASGAARPLDVSALAPGPHSISARVRMRDGSVQMLMARFNVPGLYLSYAATRADPVALNGRTVSAGNIYVFALPDSGVTRVQFCLDGSVVKTENLAPYDFSGTARDGTALPFDTLKLAKGSHTIGAHFTMQDGTVNKVNAAFYR